MIIGLNYYHQERKKMELVNLITLLAITGYLILLLSWIIIFIRSNKVKKVTKRVERKIVTDNQTRKIITTIITYTKQPESKEDSQGDYGTTFLPQHFSGFSLPYQNQNDKNSTKRFSIVKNLQREVR